MKQITKNYKHSNVGEENIINEIKKNVKKPEWIIIGGKKKWPRKCNFCGKVNYYNRSSLFHRAERINGRCKICILENPRSGWHHTDQTKQIISKYYIGKNNPFYGKHHSEKTKKLFSINNSGKNNPMYRSLGGMYGKKHNDKSINIQRQKRRDYWKSKGHECNNEFIKYRNEVTRITNKQPIYLLENYEKRGKAGIDGAYHLDHIISVWKGFHNKLTSKQISDISNLQFIPWLDNQKKWYK